jgi:hypothetical protein
MEREDLNLQFLSVPKGTVTVGHGSSAADS